MDADAGYRRIAADLRARIGRGEFPVGSVLPGITALQRQYGGVGLNQIRDAQAVLVREGMLERAQGRPTRVVASEPADEFDTVAAVRQARDVLNRVLAAHQAG